MTYTVSMYSLLAEEANKPSTFDAVSSVRLDFIMMFQPLSDFNQLSLPGTVGEVVELLYNDLPLREKVVMAHLSEDQLDSAVYLAMAKTIRKEFGLYHGNAELLRSCRGYLGREYDSYEDPAMVILKELWKKVKRTHNIRLIKNSQVPA